MKKALLAGLLLLSACGVVLSDERMDMRRDAIVIAVQKASPAVVNISTEQVVQRYFFGEQDIFDPFFDEFMHRFSRPEVATSLGSGGIFSSDGYIFTNAHVVNRASKIMVTLADSSQHPAELVNVDVASDIAVIKINMDKPLPVLVLGRSDDLMVGEHAIAVGNPFGLSSSVTEGVISALHRDVVAEGRVVFKDILQTDALINPGNSGGPLLNIFGEVIGVTTAMRADAQGIGFAIPVERVRKSLAGLLYYRKLRRMRLGFELEELYTGSGADTSLVVRTVDKSGPAYKAGCEVGDTVESVDGRRATGLIDFMVAVLAHDKGALHVAGTRQGKNASWDIVPEVTPKPDPAKLAASLLGIGIQQMERGLARDVGIDIDKGILISDVKAKSPAADAGLEHGDVILQVNDALTADLESFGLALEALAGVDKLYLVILRRQPNGVAQYAAEIELKH